MDALEKSALRTIGEQSLAIVDTASQAIEYLDTEQIQEAKSSLQHILILNNKITQPHNGLCTYNAGKLP